jgi:HPt (histidine-containing phosphotransfer) domain-containing protein
MTPTERLRRYRGRQLELLASYGELQGKIEESARAGQADLLAAQALEARRLADECAQLERAARQLPRAGGQPEELEARLEAARQAALEAGRRCRVSLSGALQELAARIRELQARPRTPPSPFARIGQPVMIDLRS